VVAEVVANSQAAASGLVHAGDVLKRTSAVFGTELWQATDFRRTMCVPTARVLQQRSAFARRRACAAVAESLARLRAPRRSQVRHPAAARR
jgi:hypothetical protein